MKGEKDMHPKKTPSPETSASSHSLYYSKTIRDH